MMFGSQPGSWASGGHMHARITNEPAPLGLAIGSQPLTGSQDASMGVAQERPFSAPSPSAAPVRGQVANKPFSYLQRPNSAPQGTQGSRLGALHLSKAPVTGLVLGSNSNTLNLNGVSSQGTIAAASPTNSYYLQQSQSQNWAGVEAQEVNAGVINHTQLSHYTNSAGLQLNRQNNLTRTQQLVTKPALQVGGFGNQHVQARPGSANNSNDSSQRLLQQQTRPGSAPPESQGVALAVGQTSSMPQQTLARALTSEVTSKKTLDALELLETRTARLQEGQTTLAASIASMSEHQHAQSAVVNERVSNIATTLYSVQQLVQESMQQMQVITTNHAQHHQLFLEHTQEARTTIIKVQDAVVQTSPMQLSTAKFANDAATTPVSNGTCTVRRMRHSSRVIHSTTVDEVVYEAAAAIGSQQLAPSPQVLQYDLRGEQVQVQGTTEVHEHCHHTANTETQLRYCQGHPTDVNHTMQQQTSNVLKQTCVPGSLRAALQECQHQPAACVLAKTDDMEGWMSKKRPGGSNSAACPPTVKQRAVMPSTQKHHLDDKPVVQNGQHHAIGVASIPGTVKRQASARGPSSISSLRGLLTGRPHAHSSASLLQRKPLTDSLIDRNTAAKLHATAPLRTVPLANNPVLGNATDTTAYGSLPRNNQQVNKGLGMDSYAKQAVVGPENRSKTNSISVLPSQSPHDTNGMLSQPQSAAVLEDDDELAQIVAERMSKHRQRRKRRL